MTVLDGSDWSIRPAHPSRGFKPEVCRDSAKRCFVARILPRWQSVPAGFVAWPPVAIIKRSANVGTMLAHRLRRWPNIVPTLTERFLFAGYQYIIKVVWACESPDFLVPIMYFTPLRRRSKRGCEWRVRENLLYRRWWKVTCKQNPYTSPRFTYFLLELLITKDCIGLCSDRLLKFIIIPIYSENSFDSFLYNKIPGT